ncbi:DUF4304 domain-containing protein [Paenibacillus sp. ClWae2A]|uniref:DUF4304 domain-containing protein n=1 Tax=Paenibacillus sp. ClWae2A TaxID=3057177 RepID=UPI0037CCB00C
MNTKDFRKLIRVYFAPKLHEVGFMGTDHHFVKTTDNHFIYTLVIQADKSGGSCVMEMGVHLDFLPNSIGNLSLQMKSRPMIVNSENVLIKKQIGLRDFLQWSVKDGFNTEKQTRMQ